MDEVKRGERVERIADGQRMQCWGVESDGQSYKCSWYEGREQRWGVFPRTKIRSVTAKPIVTSATTDWRQIKW